VAVIDAFAPFRTAVRGYDRSRVDAVIRAEQATLQRCNERIALLEHHLAASRGAAFRVDDPNRKQSIRAAADLLNDAWDYARQLVNAEDATANLQRNHAASIAAGHLAEVAAWAEEQERRARAEFDAMVAAAHGEADLLRAHASDFVENAAPMAEQLLVDAAAKSQELALAAEGEVHLRRQAMEADLTQRQAVADLGLQTAERLAAELEQESAAVTEHATRTREAALARARALTDDLIRAVAHEIAALEQESDLAMAELAQHMATLSTQLTSARKAMAVRPAGAPRINHQPQAAPAPPPEPAAVDTAAGAPVPKAKAVPRKPAQPAPRTRKTTSAAAKSAQPATEPVTEAVEKIAAPATPRLAVPETLRAVAISANGVPIVRL